MIVDAENGIKLDEDLKAEVRGLALALRYRKHEYLIIKYYSGRVKVVTSLNNNHVSVPLYLRRDRVKIMLHNHPGGVCYPSLMDRIATHGIAGVAGVYGENQVKHRREVYIYHQGEEKR